MNEVLITKFSSILLSKLLFSSKSQGRDRVQHERDDDPDDPDDYRDEINLRNLNVAVQQLYSTSAKLQLFDLQKQRISLTLENYGAILQGISIRIKLLQKKS